MANTAVAHPDNDFAGCRDQSALIAFLLIARREFSQPFGEDKRATVDRRDYEVAVPIDHSPLVTLLDWRESVTKGICFLEDGGEYYITEAVDVPGLIPLPASPLSHENREQPIRPS
jgi:hypothetical protein